MPGDARKRQLNAVSVLYGSPLVVANQSRRVKSSPVQIAAVDVRRREGSDGLRQSPDRGLLRRFREALLPFWDSNASTERDILRFRSRDANLKKFHISDACSLLCDLPLSRRNLLAHRQARSGVC